MVGPPYSDAVDISSLNAFIDAVQDATAVINPQGQILHENSAFRELRQRAQPKISTKNFFKTLSAEQYNLICGSLGDAQAGSTSSVQLTLPWLGDARESCVIDITALTFAGELHGCIWQIKPSLTGVPTRFRSLMDSLDQGVWEYKPQSGSFSASDAWHRLRGSAPDRKLGRHIDHADDSWLEKLHPDDRESVWTALQDQLAGLSKESLIPFRQWHKAGHWVWILRRASVFEADSSGRALHIVGLDSDISKAMEGQESIGKLADKLKLAVEASGIGIWEFNPATNAVHWDDRMLEIYGITDGQNIRSGNLWEKHLHPDDYEGTVAYAEECERENRDFMRDYRIRKPDGSVRYIRSMARKVESAQHASKLIGVNIDVTEDYQRAQELEAARAQLEHDALHDELTRLGNRRALDLCASDFFNQAKETSTYAVMQVDLDYFKDVNDTLGHAAGDFVLKRVARLLRKHVDKRGTVYRVGGDEFSIFFDHAPPRKDLNVIAENLINEISAPMEFEDQSCTIGASIGYAIGQGPPKTQSEIFIDADTALYAAKRAGRFTYRAYTEAIGKEFHIVSNTRQDLRDAIKAEQLVCHFQPLFDANNLTIVGAEALVRWQCPKRGLLSPFEFLPSAVDAGLLDAIDYSVFRRVIKLQDSWHEQGLGYPRISVNTSRARLEDENFLEQTRKALKSHNRIAVELLETSFYDTPSDELLFKLDTLREMQIQIEMDDFGTGYASIKALQALKPDAVKIDRSLVTPLSTNVSQIDILKNLSNIARLEGARVVVEGLETGTHMAAIRNLDCDVLQGYVLQRPMGELEFTALLNDKAKQANRFL